MCTNKSVYNINSSLIRYKTIFMLINKKPKPSEEKIKTKTAEGHAKKVKKVKGSSPNKIKGTPEKKRTKKDQNSQYNKPSAASIQQSQYYKSKESQRHSNIHKKSQIKQAKSKLLTTSPIVFEHSKSKSKSKEKSRSISKLNTYRSTQDKEILNKSITKRLFPQSKQNKSRSKEKSKSRSRLKTERDVSPLKEIKQIKKFDVADREIKYNKQETTELKKTMKKKIQNNRSKAQPFLYPSDPVEQNLIEEPKVKLKKKVPQIKTEFSQRRGSYFDENLLRKLEISRQQGKKAECPFMHIKSNFEQRFKENISFHSRSQVKATQQSIPQSNSSHNQKVELFKKQQEKKWNLMLYELQNLKNEPKVAEKIDVLIEYLNQNYVSLQEKAMQLSVKEHKSVQSNPVLVHFDSIITTSQKSSISDQDFLRNIVMPQVQGQQQVQKEIILNEKGSNEALSVKSNQSSLKFLSPISFENHPIVNNEPKADDAPKNEEEGQKVDLAFKRSTNINLSDFYNFIEKHESERKVQFQPFLKITQEDIDNFSSQIIKEQAQHKISDRNILHDLNIFDNSADFQEGTFLFKEKTEEFKQEMENIHRKKEAIAVDYDVNFHNEVRMNEEMSSQSLLLNVSDNLNRREKLVEEVQQALILDFCVTILRSKTLLHNFITTYSELLESNVINVNAGFTENRGTADASNDYVRSVIARLIGHIEENYKQSFMSQVKLPFQCRPMDILKYIRSTEEQLMLTSISEAEDNQLQAPYFNQQKIEQFETEVLKNEYFIPGYFSFNHCIYDEFNDVFEELRPYGSRGKSIFSLELSHPIVDFAVAKAEIVRRVEGHLNSKYHQQAILEQKYPNEEGVFEIVYFTCYDLMEKIFEEETLKIAQTIEISNLKKHAY